MTKLRVMLHYERSKIIQELIHGQQRSTQEIANLMKGVPLATLHRHIQVLKKYNIISEAKKVKGVTYYKIAQHIHGDSNKRMSLEEYESLFFLFMLGIMKDFENCLEVKEGNLEANGVVFRQAFVDLSEEEFQSFLHDYIVLIENYTKRKPTEKDRRTRITTLLFPLMANQNESNSKDET